MPLLTLDQVSLAFGHLPLNSGKWPKARETWSRVRRGMDYSFRLRVHGAGADRDLDPLTTPRAPSSAHSAADTFRHRNDCCPAASRGCADLHPNRRARPPGLVGSPN